MKEQRKVKLWNKKLKKFLGKKVGKEAEQGKGFFKIFFWPPAQQKKAIKF